MTPTRLVLFVAAAACATGCRSSVTLDGAVAKGPYVLGSTVIVSPLDARGAPSGDVFLTQTRNDAGEFEVTLSSPGFVALEGSGYYFNEVSGQLSGSILTLRSLYVASGAATQRATINPLTHLAQRRALQLVSDGEAPEEAIEAAEQELVTALGIGPPGFQLGRPGTDLDLLGADTDDNAYLFAVSSVLLGTASYENPGSPDAALQELLNSIGEELRTTGTLGAATRARLDQGESTLVVPDLMAHMQERLIEVGRNDSPPDLGRMIDGDHDGYFFVDDCDDRDPSIHPGAQEICGGADEDCDGLVDDADPSVDLSAGRVFHADADQDGYGAATPTMLRCASSAQWSANADDCDDTDPDVFPGAVAEATSGQCMIDRDGDGFGDATPDGVHDPGSDCEDDDADVFPGAVAEATSGQCMIDRDGDGFGDSTIDGVHDPGSDCDDDDADVFPGGVAEATHGECMIDRDGDGFGDSTIDGVHDPGSDCDDDDADVFPGGVAEATHGECMIDRDGDGFGDFTIDGVHDPGSDCDDDDAGVFPGGVAEATQGECVIDRDGDGFGDSTVDGVHDPGSDCDDDDADVFPGGVAEATQGECMIDRDGDGFGDATVDGVHDAGSDCDDDDDAIRPGATEIWYDGTDQNCDGLSDFDADFDGHDVDEGDCDDASPVIHPDAAELCDGINNRCLESWTPAAEAGLAAWQSEADDFPRDVTAFVTGSENAPAVYELSSAGTLRFCDGWFDVRVVTEHPATIESMNGAAHTTLSARHMGSVVESYTTATLQGLTIRDGSGTQADWGEWVGGGVYFEGSLVIDSVILSDNDAIDQGSGLFGHGTLTVNASRVENNRGTGIYVWEGAVSIEDSVLSDNDGYGVYTEGSTLTVRRTQIERNAKPGPSGSAGVQCSFGSLTLEDVNLVDNEIGVGVVHGPASIIHTHISGSHGVWTMYLSWSDVEFMESTLSDNGTSGRDLVSVTHSSFVCDHSSIVRNTAHGSVFHIGEYESTITSVACDWGDGDGDNAPADIKTVTDDDTIATYNYGANASFFCGQGSCTP